MFKNSIDIYNAVLVELNKEFNPSFETWDYTYFINKAILEWIKRKYNEYELTQKRTDDLQLITIRNFDLQLIDNISTLPNDYLFLLGVRAKTLSNKCEDKPVIKECYKMTSDRKGYEDSNYYAKFKTWYELSRNKIYIIPEKGKKINEILIEYIAKPEYQNIDLDNYFSLQNTVNILFTIEYIAIEIIKLCASMFLENIEQPRTQGHIQINEQLMIN